MHRLRLALLFGTLLSIVGADAAPQPHEVTITFIHFNDLHAHLMPHADVVPDAPAGQAANKTKVVERGGLARFATLIKRIRAENPHNVLMNIGDTYHGGVEAFFTQGNAVVDPVNALNIDVGVPGNWDFAYGPAVTRLRYTDTPMAAINEMMAPMRARREQTNPMDAEQEPRGMRRRMRERRAARSGSGPLAAPAGEAQAMEGMMPMGKIKRPNFPNLAANVTFTAPPMQAGRTILPPTLIKEIAGVKIGFIGITSDIVPEMHPMLALGMSFLKGEDAYKALVNRYAKSLREQGAQIVVVMSELGIHKDYRLAQIVDAGIDVFFSAHTHEAVFTPLTSKSGALVVEAGNDGYLGRMDITLRDGKISAHHWQLLTVDSTIPADREMQALVDRARAPFLAKNINMRLPTPMGGQALTQPIDTVVGHIRGSIDRTDALESSFNDTWSDILRAQGDTQIALTPGFRFASTIGAIPIEDNTVATGKVTIEDVYRLFPVPYTLATAKVSGEHLRATIEQVLTKVFSPNPFNQVGGWMDGYSGLHIDLDLAAPDGARVQAMRLANDDRAVAPTTRLTITGCKRPLDQADTLCSYGGFEEVSPLINAATGHAWTPVDLFIDRLKHGVLVPVPRHDFVDRSAIRRWPESPYVQPLPAAPP